MTYIADEKELSFRLPPSDIDVIDFLLNAEFKKEVKAIFGISDFGKTTQISRIILLKSVTHLIESIKSNPKALPYVYGLKQEIPRGSGMYSTGSGGSTGYLSDGTPYYIEGGLNKCELSKRRKNKSGKYERYDTQDVRHLKVIKVNPNDIFGDIIIYKKRKPTKLLSNLKQLESFLSKARVKTIKKILG